MIVIAVKVLLTCVCCSSFVAVVFTVFGFIVNSTDIENIGVTFLLIALFAFLFAIGVVCVYAAYVTLWGTSR